MYHRLYHWKFNTWEKVKEKLEETARLKKSETTAVKSSRREGNKTITDFFTAEDEDEEDDSSSDSSTASDKRATKLAKAAEALCNNHKFRKRLFEDYQSVIDEAQDLITKGTKEASGNVVRKRIRREISETSQGSH